MPFRRIFFALCLLAALLLGGCTAFGLVYERLDWYAAWRMDRYVSLDDRQKAERESQVARLWRWHRAEELPRYARDLRELATALDQPLSPERVQAFVDRGEQHWRRATLRALPSFCDLLATLDDGQVAQLLRRIDRDNRDFAERYVEPPEAERRRDSGRRLQRTVERWTGTLEPPQRQLLLDWAMRRREWAAQWLDWRRDWRQRFAAALQQRRQPQACDRLERLMVRPLEQLPPALEVQRRANGRQWAELISQLATTLTPRQRAHARHELLEFAEQLEALSRRAI